MENNSTSFLDIKEINIQKKSKNYTVKNDGRHDYTSVYYICRKCGKKCGDSAAYIKHSNACGRTIFDKLPKKIIDYIRIDYVKFGLSIPKIREKYIKHGYKISIGSLHIILKDYTRDRVEALRMAKKNSTFKQTEESKRKISESQKKRYQETKTEWSEDQKRRKEDRERVARDKEKWGSSLKMVMSGIKKRKIQRPTYDDFYKSLEELGKEKTAEKYNITKSTLDTWDKWYQKFGRLGDFAAIGNDNKENKGK